MIGNDLVDLELARSLGSDKKERWLEKVFTKGELDLIDRSDNPFLKVWQFWSMKEAAYKRYHREYALAPILNPKQYECITNSKIRIANEEYLTTTKITENYIHSFTSASKVNTVGITLNTITARTKLKMLIAERFLLDLSKLRIDKDSYRIPNLFYKKKRLDLNISLSHDGIYSSYIVNL